MTNEESKQIVIDEIKKYISEDDVEFFISSNQEWFYIAVFSVQKAYYKGRVDELKKQREGQLNEFKQKFIAL